MDKVSTAVDFISKDSLKLPSTYDLTIICAFILVAIFVASLFFLLKKDKKKYYIGVFVPLAILVVGGFAFNNLKFASAANNSVPERLYAVVDNDQKTVTIDKGSVKYFDPDSFLSFYAVDLSNNEGDAISTWNIKLDNVDIYNNKAGNENIFESPKFIEDQELELVLSTDMSMDVANSLIGKQSVSIEYKMQSECWASGSVDYESPANDDSLEGIDVSFVDIDGATLTQSKTDADGEYALHVKQGATGHIHFSGKVANYDTPDFTVGKHMVIEQALLNKKAEVLNYESLAYNMSEQTGLVPNNGAELVSGDIKATDIGTYSATFNTKKGFAWEDSSTGEKTFNWCIIGAYVRHDSSEKSLKFMYGTDYDSSTDKYVLNAENVDNKTDIPWHLQLATITKVIFDSSFKDYPVSQSAWWFEGAILVKSFEGMENLNLVLDPNKRGTESMFNGCYLMTSFDLSHLNTTNSKNFSWMFYNCWSLKNIDLSPLNSSSVTDMNHMFGECNSLETINFGNFDTSSVDNMASMFESCWNLTSLDLSSFNTANAGNMSNMFCMHNTSSVKSLSGPKPTEIYSKLVSIKFGENFVTSNVTEMEKMFYYCVSLKTLDLRNFETSSVWDFSSFLDTCKSLKSVTGSNDGVFDFSNFNFGACQNTSWFVSGCSSATQIISPNSGFKYLCDAGGMFAYCENLETVNCSNLDTSNVTSFYCMFAYDQKLAKLNAGTSGDFNISNFDTSNATTLESMFEFNYELISLIGPSTGFSTVGCTLEALCYNAKSLSRVDMSNCDLSNVISMQYSFCLDYSDYGPSNLVEANLSKGVPGRAKGYCNFDYTFSNLHQDSGENQLMTIYCEPDADWGLYAESGTGSNMFNWDTKIKGGNNTGYIDGSATYAREDKVGQQGYFTALL